MRLKEMREERKYTKTDIAKLLGVYDTSYGRWERNVETIPTKRLYELANIYNINIDYLSGLTNLRLKMNVPNNLNLKEIGKHVRELRLELNMTLKEISERLKISRSTWNKYELGKILISYTYLIEVCKLSKISIDYVLCRSKVKYLSDYQ